LRLSFHEDARLWNTMGHLTIWMGKPDEAVSFFKKAVELDQNLGPSYSAGGMLWFVGIIGRSATGNRFGPQGIPRIRMLYFKICQEAILGNPETAQDLLRSSIAEGRISKISVQRDPIWREVLVTR
jgi:hypothetical protein